MSQIDSIVDSILTVDVNEVDIDSLFNQKLAKFDFAISSSVEKSRLL